eukprot:TRINITY_DN4518_c0_g1_i1.p1 TRINITY_DN4518_c0_g1~~TRINITY_DN4518_c0_g1_i1.p1  ORF type:complete len:121 (+),score=22.73 TRINITY_DN4518_c0_g1_i1:586-948(+)
MSKFQIIFLYNWEKSSLKGRKGECGIILHHTHWKNKISIHVHLFLLKLAFDKMGLDTILWKTLEDNGPMRHFLEDMDIPLIVEKNIIKLGEEMKNEVCYCLKKEGWGDAELKLKNKLITN